MAVPRGSFTILGIRIWLLLHGNQGCGTPSARACWLSGDYSTLDECRSGVGRATPLPNGKRRPESHWPVIWASNPLNDTLFVHECTALSMATYFTLLAQGRLVHSAASRDIRYLLSSKRNWFKAALPSADIASKVGLITKCIKQGSKIKHGKPVIECSQLESTHVHEAGLIENGRYRYAVAIMTVGIPKGVSLLQQLIGELDGLIRRNG